tara:strand:- start:34 stop:756 length:723 start_codon:yes stop_codon:yes gene_type:complete
MIKEKYSIKLNNFEGPMDLLLYFINRDRIDIYDIPILKITKDYLEYIDIMEKMDIDLGAEFIYMSTLLIQIKARMLLPKAIDENSEELEDPRVELIHRILEYKRFKNISNELQEKLDSHNKRHPKGNSMDYSPSVNIDLLLPRDVKLFDLAKTFKNILDNLPENNELDVVVEKISLQEQMNFIREILVNKKKFYLTEIIADNSKIYVVSLFLAILELIKIKEINFKQTKNFSDIIISRLG